MGALVVKRACWPGPVTCRGSSGWSWLLCWLSSWLPGFVLPRGRGSSWSARSVSALSGRGRGRTSLTPGSGSRSSGARKGRFLRG